MSKGKYRSIIKDKKADCRFDSRTGRQVKKHNNG